MSTCTLVRHHGSCSVHRHTIAHRHHLRSLRTSAGWGPAANATATVSTCYCKKQGAILLGIPSSESGEASAAVSTGTGAAKASGERKTRRSANTEVFILRRTTRYPAEALIQTFSGGGIYTHNMVHCIASTRAIKTCEPRRYASLLERFGRCRLTTRRYAWGGVIKLCYPERRTMELLGNNDRSMVGAARFRR
ncbi:hypothetical protein DENSPDRAFT_704023 [Dentipellis sp. KUC8613]|nr:hypothetical protein DENSPDRAFT_704023 [Dentipellis sp. KUC8613]